MVNKRDPDAAKRQILDAAARAFATSGPAGARIDAIAADAGVNKRMLYHYFGDKQALFAAVIDDRLGDPMLPGAAGSLADGLELEPEDLRLMVWAAIGAVELPIAGARVWQRWVAELAAEQDAGRLRDDVDAALVALVLIAVSVVPGLLPGHARLVGPGPGSLWSGVRTLLQPLPAGARTESRGRRPRVRMLPEVRGR
jgi:AcrR family transcriptional regulator